jgi:hypothetical protein
MNFLTAFYTVLMFVTIGYKRKPWFYGLPETHPILKTELVRYCLVVIFAVHTVIACYYSTTIYKTLL